MNYKNLKAKTESLRTGERLGENENPFSTNKVTGHSLNYPIHPTCAPTKVCVEECYFGQGPSTWTAALKKQWRLYASTVADPEKTANAIVRWARKLKLPFVRWNGGGDLFSESVLCINHAAPQMPDVPQWVVTRLPHHAVNLASWPNVFVHFSVDKSSWTRLAAMRPQPGNWFWSYQCDRDEVPPAGIAPVVFRNHYDPQGSPLTEDDCPLNAAEDIAGTCDRCRRCFDGRAVSRGRELRHILDEMV